MIIRVSSFVLYLGLSLTGLNLQGQALPLSSAEEELLAEVVEEILAESRQPRSSSLAAQSSSSSGSSDYAETGGATGRDVDPPPGAAHYDPAVEATAISALEPANHPQVKGSPSIKSDLSNSQSVAKSHPTAIYATGTFEPEPGLDPQLAAAAAKSGTGGRPSLFAFIQIDRILTRHVRAELEETGTQVLGPHGDFHKVKLSRQNSSVETAIDLPFVRWLGLPNAEQKVDVGLAALVGHENAPNRLPLVVNVFDEDSDGLFRRALEDIGLTVGNWDPDLLAYRVVAEASQIDEVVRMDFVLFVELVGFTRAGHDQDMPVIGMDYLRTGGPGTNFNASSIILGIMDTGFMMGGSAATMHNDLSKWGCGLNFTADLAGVWNDEQGHGTHVIGTILGTGTANSRYRGAADGIGGSASTSIRAAKVWGSDNMGMTAWMESAMDFFDNASECGSPAPQVINISGGAFSLNLVGTDSLSRKLDAKVWTYGQFYVVAAGNDGLLGAGTVGTPGVAKNTLAVGNVRSEGYSTIGDIWATSSRGPTGDGRMKPNVVAPGTSTTSAWAGTTSLYTDKTGTSMATPHVSGLAATVMEHYPDFQGRPALLRAHLMATAILHDDATTPENNSGGGRNTYGLGRVSTYVAHWAHDNPNGWTGHWGWGTVDDDTWVQYDISVPADTDRLVVVTTWDEPAASAGAPAAVAYDLDLWIDRDADCTPDEIGQCGEWASLSFVDNVEYLIVSNPPEGTYRLKTIPFSAPLSGLPIGMAAAVIRGDPTPAMDLTAVLSNPNPITGETFTVTTSLSSPSYVSSGVHLSRTSFPADIVQDDVSTTREDNIAMSFGGASELTLGNVHEGDTRSATWTLRATTAGNRTLSFQTWSENGGTDMVDVPISVSGCSDGFEPDGNSGQAKTITPGVSKNHSICPVSDEDWSTFTLTELSGATLTTSGLVGDTRMWLRDATTAQIEFNDDSGDGLFSSISRICGIDALPAGTYFVEVDEFGDNEQIGSYALDLTTAPCGCVTDLVLGNQTITQTQTLAATATATLGPNLIVNGTNIAVNAPTVSILGGTSIGGSFSVGNNPVCP